ncbi:hypothetical protein PAXINDRAFT_180143 [Paxillus involutus ATCC 200175]|nr:hypothetical protein PAXINDRAFT_180143 [Paxillus involutus ATCC 200175]
MFRSILQTQHLRRASLTVQHRSFASTVLLSRTWENETVLDLRKEAKTRGLSTKGNKSTLITRIQEYEDSRVVSTSRNTTPVHDTLAASRSASTKAVPRTTPASFPVAPQSASPGIPPAAQLPTTSLTYIPLAIKLPDLSRPIPEAPNQVPYVPDFWDSARPREDIPSEPGLPKLHVIGGSAIHHGGGPTHNLEEPQEGHTVPLATINADEAPSTKVGLWADVLDDLGLPRSFSVRQSLREAGTSVVEAVKDRGNGYRTSSRALNNDERMGLYVLLGLTVGSWVVGGAVNGAAPAPAVKEEHSSQDKH